MTISHSGRIVEILSKPMLILSAIMNYECLTYKRNKCQVWNFTQPFVEQIGPFMYEESFQREDIEYVTSSGEVVPDQDQGEYGKKELVSIRARQRTYYKSIYDPNDPKTGLDPNTRIVMPNWGVLSLYKIIAFQCFENENCTDKDYEQLTSLIQLTLSGFPDSFTKPILPPLTANELIWSNSQTNTAENLPNQVFSLDDDEKFLNLGFFGNGTLAMC